MNEWDTFDQELAESLRELPPPDDTVKTVTPWREAMRRIVTGLCLTSITISFAYLQYLLPAIGTVQLYLGFRSLRENNRWFRLAWYVSICRAVLLYTSDILIAAPSSLLPEGVWLFLTLATALALFLFLHMGLVQAAKDVGQPMKRHPALWAAVWYTVLFLIALFLPDLGLFALLPMLAAFIGILKSLRQAGEELERWGCAVRASRVKVSGSQFSLLYLASLLLAVLLTAGASNHIPAPSYEQAFDPSETADIEVRLLDLGFPEDLLARLPPEELLRLDGARYCSFDRGDETHGAGSKKGQRLIRFDTVYVQLDDAHVRVYEFFNLRKDTLRSNFRTMTMLDPGAEVLSDITGGLTWTQDGTACRSQLPISRQTYTNMFWGSSDLPSAIFSYPFFSRDRGGYMAYTGMEEDGTLLTCSVLRAYLTTYRNFYPYESLNTDTFRTDFYAQSYSTFDFRNDPASS